MIANIGVASPRRLRAAKLLLGALTLTPGNAVAALVKWRLRKSLSALPAPEREFYQAYLNDQADRCLTKERMLNQYRCMLDFIEHYAFTAYDLDNWPGRMLILESADDTGWTASERRALRVLYPRAQVHTFREAGHLSGVVRRDEYDAVVKAFLRNT